jgi:hypothetical protein
MILTWIVARHAISEKLTLYPAMEKHLGDVGVQLAKTDKDQHLSIPFGGQADLFSAIGHRLRNLGVHPLKLAPREASPIGLGLPGGHPLNKPPWQGRGRPSITQRGKHAMLIA